MTLADAIKNVSQESLTPHGTVPPAHLVAAVGLLIAEQLKRLADAKESQDSGGKS